MAVLRLIGVTVDLERGLAVRRGHPTPLTATEARLLAYLHAQGGAEVPRDVALREVWGYRPGVQSRTLDTTMRRLREKVELDPAAPRHLLTVHGRGYRFVAAPSLPAAGPIFGREAEHAELTTALGRARVVSLIGRPGMGRRTLARAVAAGWGPASALPDTGDPEQLDRALTDALGVRPARTPSEWARVIAGLGDHLLVAAPMGETARDTLAAWLPTRLDLAPGLRLILVATAPLGLPEEQIFRLGGLPEAAAVALLQARGVALPEPTLRALARAWDGWPLALHLVAERIRQGGPAQPDCPLQEPTLRDILTTTWAAAAPPTRDALLTLAVCRPGAPRAWLDAVHGAPFPEPDAPLRGWLARGDLRLPDALAAWLRALPDSSAVAERHAQACLDAALTDPDGDWPEAAERALDHDGPARYPLALALAEREIGLGSGAQARRRLDHAAALRPPGTPEAPWLLLDGWRLHVDGDYEAAAARYTPLLDEPSVADEAHVRLALARLNQGAHDAARALVEGRVLPADRDLDLHGAAVLATVYQVRTDPAGVAAWRAVLATAERRGRRRLLARWLPNLAVTLRTANREAEADRVLRRAIELQAEVGDVRNEAASRVNLAQARYDLGDLAAADTQLDVVTTLLTTHDAPRVWQHALAVRAAMAIEAGDTLRARSLLEEALQAYPHGFGPQAVWGLLGSAWWREGVLAEAEAAFGRSLEALAKVAAPPRVVAVTRARWLGVRAEQGRSDDEPWPTVSPGDSAAAALAAERLHVLLTAVVAGRAAVGALVAAWVGLPPARIGLVRVSRLLLRARAERAGVLLPETL